MSLWQLAQKHYVVIIKSIKKSKWTVCHPSNDAVIKKKEMFSYKSPFPPLVKFCVKMSLLG